MSSSLFFLQGRSGLYTPLTSSWMCPIAETYTLSMQLSAFAALIWPITQQPACVGVIGHEQCGQLVTPAHKYHELSWSLVDIYLYLC